MEWAGNQLYNGYKKAREFVEGSLEQIYQNGFTIPGFADEDMDAELAELENVVDVQTATQQGNSILSYKNKRLFQKLISALVTSFEGANKLSLYRKLKYGLAYLVIQGYSRLAEWEIPFKDPKFEIDRKLERLAYFSKFAVGIYGPDELYESTIEEQKSLLFHKGTDREQFLFWSNTTEDELLECFFENREFL
jgi:hypothetical protein